jgi:hypothetical protein
MPLGSLRCTAAPAGARGRESAHQVLPVERVGGSAGCLAGAVGVLLLWTSKEGQQGKRGRGVAMSVTVDATVLKERCVATAVMALVVLGAAGRPGSRACTAASVKLQPSSCLTAVALLPCHHCSSSAAMSPRA